VPAWFTWVGSGSGSGAEFDTLANWVQDGSAATRLPAAGDDLHFMSSLAGGCDDMHGPSGGAYASVNLTGGYASTVTLESGFTTAALVMTAAGAAFSQPGSGTDITVTGEFEWTRGTLNNSGYLSTLTLDGATATITPLTTGGLMTPPTAGTVYLGSNITLENGAVATMGEGTIEVNKRGVQFTTSTGSQFAINPGALGEAIIGALQPALPPEALIMAGTSWTLYAGHFTFGGAVGNAGTVTLMPNTIFAVLGDSDTEEGYVQWGQNSATYLHGSSTLVSPFQPVLIQGGTLATVWADSVSSGTGTIIAPTVTVSGGDIYVCMQQGSHVQFGELIVDGNLEWTGGTYHPYVYSGGVSNDVWRQTTVNSPGSQFTITGGTVAPVYLDLDYGTSSTPHSGDWWKILKAGGGFADGTAPSVDNTTLWSLAIDPDNPPIFWKLVAN
jgi:hypothetical protein